MSYGSGVLFSATSHVAGKNARVVLLPDRIEWTVGRSWLLPGVVAFCTCFLSLIFYRGIPKQTSSIPVRSISHISTQRDGALNTVVYVNSAAGSIGFRVSHDEASRLQSALYSQMSAPATR